MKYLTLIISLTIFTFFGCTEDTLIENETELVVVSAFLYAGEPVEDIRLTKTLPLGSEDSLAPPISNANITLVKNDGQYVLTPNLDKEGYYFYDGDDLDVKLGDNFKIEIEYLEELISAETVVPSTPKNVSTSESVLKVPEIDFRELRGGGLDLQQYSILINWDNPDASLYYVVIDNLDNNTEMIFGDLPFNPARRFISTPLPVNEYVVNLFTITHFGNHRAIVYKVNKEYADLYESREQDSRNLNEPLSNIVNGLGVFSAFASDTVYFNVIKE